MCVFFCTNFSQFKYILHLVSIRLRLGIEWPVYKYQLDLVEKLFIFLGLSLG